MLVAKDLMPTPAYDKPPSILLVDGEVVVVGPGPVAFSMTREAAAQMCSLLSKALEAEA